MNRKEKKLLDAGKDKDYREFTFSNGIRLLYKQAVETRISHGGFIIDAGSRDETKAEMGLAHFIEHMLFKGTRKRNYRQILDRLEIVGGELNAYTTRDKTCIYASIIESYTERAVELLADVTFRSTFPQQEMEKEKKVVAEEIAMYQDNPEETIFDEFQELVYKDHSMGYPILGTRKHLMGYTQADLLSFQARHYHTGGIVFAYVGPVPFERIQRIVGKYIADIPENKGAQKRKPFSGYVPFNITKNTRNSQTYGMVGGLAYDLYHPHRAALLLLNNLLGGPGLNSRLNLSIRERFGYAYSIESNYYPYTDTGLFSVFVGTDRNNLDHCLELIEKEFKRLRDKPMSTLVLFRYKMQFIGQITMAEESKVGLMLALGKTVLDHDRVDTLHEVIEKINAVTPEEITEVAREILDPKVMSRLIYLSRK